MCRWMAWHGQPVLIDELLFKTQHGLIDQSLHSRLGAETTNGDGFGVGWYGSGEGPGTYHSIQPAWGDANLRRLARHIESPLFLSHVRATSGTALRKLHPDNPRIQRMRDEARLVVSESVAGPAGRVARDPGGDRLDSATRRRAGAPRLRAERADGGVTPTMADDLTASHAHPVGKLAGHIAPSRLDATSREPWLSTTMSRAGPRRGARS